MPSIRLRIISDLHFAEGPSRIARIGMIRPLLEAAGQTILNGDSVDTRFVDTRTSAADGLAVFREFIAPYGQQLMLITGNHDPDISPHHHAELMDGRVLVTHGDVLFPAVAPWGWEAPHVLVAREKRLAELPIAEHDRFETQLGVSKHASYATRHLSPSAHDGGGGVLEQFVRLASRIRRADKVLSSWFHTPSLATRLAAKHRPKAEIVILGHTHYPGIWRREGRWIINTGAFTPPLGATAVDFVEGRVEVRAIVKRADEFRTGNLLRTLEVGRDLAAPFC